MTSINEVRDMLLRVLDVYTPSGEEWKLHEPLQEISSRLGYENYFVDKVGNFIAEYGFGKTILLAGHMDTVPGKLDVKVSNDEVWGRGAVDAKGPLIAMLLGAAKAKDSVKGVRVVVACLVDEEREGKGANYLVDSGFKADHIIIGEPTGTTGVAIGYRGSLTVRVNVYASGGHSSAPYMGESALDKFFTFWEEIKRNFSGRGYDETSACITVLEAGDWPTKLPEFVRAVINIRIPCNMFSKQILSKLEELCLEHGCELLVLERTEPVKVSLSSPVPRSLIRGMLKIGMKPKAVMKTGTSDMNVIYRISSDIAAYGPGDSLLAHTTLERISVKDVLTAAEVYKNCILELASFGQTR
ncbi:MAG: N-acetyl-lysine deacetylase [Nitrososphaerota archaeon]|nr:N-acetyl-lysine deacetylase [Aigarchaeota archaeon]MDW8076240.1 N-acetyl-lysine deacetylase [Nitrososphaerota archaeon]